MPRIPVMQAVVEILKSEGVDTVFGCPGAAILPLYQSLQGSGIEHLIVRHEEGATHMADGWARTTGGVGVAIGTSGPAGTNMITGLYTAQADSVPILCITGQADSRKLHTEAFQAVDIVEIAKPVTKWAVQAKEAAQLPWIFREAFRIARSGRPGPVLIDLPIDVQKQLIEWDSSIDSPLPITVPTPSAARVERALDMLLAAERPLILAGGGVVLGEASERLLAVAEKLGVPVGVTLMGKGSFPEGHELFAGMAGIQTSQRWANAAFLESDLVLALGARFGDRHTGAFLDALLVAIEGRAVKRSVGRAWVDRLSELKEALPRRDDFESVPIKAPRVFKEINDYYGEDTYFVTAIGLYQIWSGQFQKAHKPRHYQVCGQAGPLGWEIPAAIGVKKAKPEAEVVGVVGDYSFQFLVEELAVAAQYDVGFVLIMLNNEYLGLIRQAETGYDMNFEVDIHYDANGTDNVKIMEAYGCAGVRVVDPTEIRASLEWAKKEADRTSRPVLVEIMIEREGNAAMGKALDSVVEFEPVP